MASVRQAGVATPPRGVVKRRIPRLRDVKPLFDLSVSVPRREHALARCGDVFDIRELAMRRVPRMVFDFVDGAAGSESSLRRARAVFGRVEMEPSVLRDVRRIDPSIDLLGKRQDLPFFFAPTGGTRLLNVVGEAGVAQVAGESGIAYALSTLGTTSVEDLAAAAPDTRRWFQLYLMSDRIRGREMARRAWDAGYDTLQISVDTPVPGRRNRDVRNGLVAPPKLTWRTMARVAGSPRWCFDALTTEPIRFAMVDAESELPAARMKRVFDAGVTVRDLEWLRQEWPGRLVVKGIQSLHDAQLVASTGIDGIELSSHGGRQMDHAPVPFELLPAVREAVDPRVQVFVDGGVMTGTDIVVCLAQGADAVGLGRAYLYGLMAGGVAGVRRVVDLLRAEIDTALRLLGCTDVQELKNVPIRVRDN